MEKKKNRNEDEIRKEMNFGRKIKMKYLVRNQENKKNDINSRERNRGLLTITETMNRISVNANVAPKWHHHLLKKREKPREKRKTKNKKTSNTKLTH